MAVQFQVTDRQVDGETRVIAVAGEIDVFSAPEFKQRTTASIDEGASRLVVDLTATTFIDSSSLGVLIGAHRRLQERGGRLAVVCHRESILKTLQITGLDGVFAVEPTLEAALAAD